MLHVCVPNFSWGGTVLNCKEPRLACSVSKQALWSCTCSSLLKQSAHRLLPHSHSIGLGLFVPSTLTSNANMEDISLLLSPPPGSPKPFPPWTGWSSCSWCWAPASLAVTGQSGFLCAVLASHLAPVLAAGSQRYKGLYFLADGLNAVH